MKFKIDENLPAETAETLRQYGFAADTVADEDLSGLDDVMVVARSQEDDRILIALDLDFANIRAVLSYVRRLAAALANRSPQGELWIIDSNRIRFRQGS